MIHIVVINTKYTLAHTKFNSQLKSKHAHPVIISKQTVYFTVKNIQAENYTKQVS